MIRFVAWINIAAALGFVWFWTSFHAGWSFPMEELRTLIPNFDGYYGWETSFIVPDLLVASAMGSAGLALLRNPQHRMAAISLVFTAGACMFLVVLDTTYALRNGLYTLGHPFSYDLLSVPLGLTPVVLLTLGVLGPRLGLGFSKAAWNQQPGDKT
ncbi:hypothetical protein [Rhodoferax sp. UBA5149]|uniref:hypothetical protein n=1 Tax=Rhodoferax sp. UBA5149 TaxID=1947379 RepID=UPI0025F9E740|nr:hypothetical protein [Rhodoferax sp. UBA5149]